MTHHNQRGKNNQRGGFQNSNENKVSMKQSDIMKHAVTGNTFNTQFVDTHCHWPSTLSSFLAKNNDNNFMDMYTFIEESFGGKVCGIVNVHCEAPVRKEWKEIAESEQWEKLNMNYGFAIGVHPHNAKDWNASVESDLLEAIRHPKCVAWGECGLDYHYDKSPRKIQQEVFIKQIELAVSSKKPLVVHTREADEDVYEILVKHAPKEHKIHVHCFTDSPQLAQKLIEHFPNLYIGITGVITFSSNKNTAEVVKSVAPLNRLLLETDSPFMVPANFTRSLPIKNVKPSISHAGMIPWTAKFVADILKLDTEEVLKVTRENAKDFYGV